MTMMLKTSKGRGRAFTFRRRLFVKAEEHRVKLRVEVGVLVRYDSVDPLAGDEPLQQLAYKITD